MSAERRAHQRFSMSLGAELRVGDQTVDAATLDVSRGGCRVEVDRLLPEGDTLAVSLFPTVDGVQEAGFEPLRIGAEVRWAAETEATSGLRFTAGLKFVALSDAQGDWLEAIVARSQA